MAAKANKYVAVNFLMEVDTHKELMGLCTRHGDKAFLLNKAVRDLVKSHKAKIKKWNERMGR